MNYFELDCIPSIKEHSEILIVKLGELGFESFLETELGFKGYVQQELFTETVKGQLLDLHRQFQFKEHLKLIPDENWNQEWEKNFSPINVDNLCYICASFHPPVSGFRYTVVVNPKMSFGTGHHETTALVVSQLLKLDLKGKRVCDMGCGTGILGILSSKMDAQSVLAIDTDQWAVENSLENIDTNKVTGIVVKKGDVQQLAGNSFHVILANINRNVLLSDMEQYVRSLTKEGILIVSGFFDMDAPRIKAKAEDLGLEMLEDSYKNKWAMLCLVKKI